MKKLFEGKILTVPNLLSCLRLALLPFLVLSCSEGEARTTLLLLLVSAATDVADGLVARRFDQVSNLGKALDPLADKLTQAAMLICLAGRFPLMTLPFALMVVKEVLCAGSALAAIERTGEVRSSGWHGKLASVLLNAMLIAHILWAGMPPEVSLCMILPCAAAIVLSGVLYGVGNLRRIRGGEPPKAETEK